jgi:TonB-linked SusC/RagA family outer membrane protein
MTNKIALIGSSPLYLKRLKLAMKLITILFMFGTIQVFAASVVKTERNVYPNDFQQKSITGQIKDVTGNTLAGVNIIEKGTTNGAISDANGKYSINVASANSVLSFSFIGFVVQDVTVGPQTLINVTLVESVSALEEIVVVGYSTQQRKSLTGAVSTVNAASLAESAASNPVQRLQGKVAGVTVLNQHTPGEGSTLRIRGMTTINDANPLFVVDGIPGGNYSPNDVESITILKDAAAQSIYGARAANGVVLVTTKSGKKNQKISMTVNIRQGITKNSTHYNLLNTQEWGDMLWLESKNLYDKNHRAWAKAGTGTEPVLSYNHVQFGTGATPVIPDYIFPTKTAEGSPLVDPKLYDNKLAVVDGTDTYLIAKSSQGTDFMKESERNAQIKDYTIDVTGGSANTTYAFLLGYTKEDGVFKYTGFDRYSFRANINSSPAKWIDLGTNIGGNYTNDYGYQANDNSESSIVSWTYRLPTMVPLYDISGTTYGGSRSAGMGNAQNSLFLLDKNQYDFTKQMNLTGNAYLKLNLMKGLSVQTRIGINHYQYNSQDISYVEVAAAERGTYDYYGKGAGWGINWTWTNTIDYSLITGQHNLKAIIGTEAFDNSSESIGANRSEYPILDVNYMNLNTGLRSINNSGGGTSMYSLFSIFGRLNYTYADKYMVEAVVRRDGSSRFGTQKYGVFPAVSLGWRISQEGFMASTKSWLDELKLRVGYGVVGNDRMGNYNSFSQYAINFNSAFYPISGSNSATGTTGFAQTTFGNPDVKWETTATTNIGIDATVFKGLTLNFDVWQRVTSDMLYPKQLPLIYGTASTPSINIGEMKNTGFDITLGYTNSVLNGDLHYGVDLVFSHYKNELTKLTDNAGDFYQGSGYREKIYTRTESGRAFPEFFGYVVEGLFQTQAEVDAWPKAFGATGTYNDLGHYKYKDVDGNGYIDAADRTYIGSPHPDFTAGFSLSIDYKGIFLSTTLYASVGNDVVNYVSRFIDYTQFESGKSHRRLYESWGSPYLNGDNSKATMPIIYSNDTPHQEASTAFIEDGSFLRMKTMRIGYDVNRLLKNKLSSLQIYFQGSNLFTVTNYSGLDPELAGAGINMGIDSGAWPTPKQFMFGITFGL